MPDILDAVRTAMQAAEEIGGPEGPEYIALMQAIASEAQRRIAAYRAPTSAPIPDPEPALCHACFCPEELPAKPLIAIFEDGRLRHPECHAHSDAHDRLPSDAERREVAHGILTVGQLRRVIADLPDSVQVIVDGYPLDHGLEYLNVPCVVVPSRHGEDYAALTLEVAHTFDPRQF